MTTALLLLLAGLLLLVKGGDWFVTAAVRLAEFLRMPHVVIGSTLVSLATTTPEFAVSIMAGLRGEAGLAVGNAVGSVICNLGLIVGLTAVLRHVHVHWKTLRRALFTMLGLGLLLVALTWDLRLSRLSGAALVALGLGYFAWDFLDHYRNRQPATVREAVAIQTEAVGDRPFLATPAGAILQFLGGAGVVVVGSRLLVEGAVTVAQGLGVPPLVIGLTVVAAGTSLPELITAITSSRRNVSDLSLGNVLGANIANLSLIVGAAALLQDITLDRVAQAFHLAVMLGFMAVVALFVRTGSRVTRAEGAVLLGAYIAYLGVVLAWMLAVR
jgi:cation:H+ antiporter